MSPYGGMRFGLTKGNERLLVQCKRVTSGAFSIGPIYVFLLPHECNSESFARLPARIVRFGFNVAGSVL